MFAQLNQLSTNIHYKGMKRFRNRVIILHAALLNIYVKGLAPRKKLLKTVLFFVNDKIVDGLHMKIQYSLIVL